MSAYHHGNSRKENREFWTAQVQNFYLSNLSQKEFCRRNSLVYASFGYWKRQLERGDPSSPIEFVEVDPELVRETAVAVTLSLERCDVRIHNGADPAMVERILRGLQL